MKKSTWIWIVFVFGILFQWYTLGSWVYKEEKTIKQGLFIKIPCRQLDPKDPFRGTYLNINPTPGQVEFEDSALYQAQQSIWINYIQEDQEIYRFHSIQPITETPMMPVYIQAKVKYVYPLYTDSIYSATIEYPFSNLYINEKDAPRLLDQYNQAMTDTTQIVYAGLFVLSGKAALDGLWIGNKKLE